MRRRTGCGRAVAKGEAGAGRWRACRGGTGGAEGELRERRRGGCDAFLAHGPLISPAPWASCAEPQLSTPVSSHPPVFSCASHLRSGTQHACIATTDSPGFWRLAVSPRLTTSDSEFEAGSEDWNAPMDCKLKSSSCHTQPSAYYVHCNESPTVHRCCSQLLGYVASIHVSEVEYISPRRPLPNSQLFTIL